jgi:hypothetical protein
MRADDVVQITRYERSTGRILDTGTTCLPETLASDMEAVLVGQQAPSIDGHRVDVVTRKILQMPPAPSSWHVFDYRRLAWVDPRTVEELWFSVRAERDMRLAATDWTQLPDVPLATRNTWTTYRQALRDVTRQADPLKITWPAPPV